MDMVREINKEIAEVRAELGRIRKELEKAPNDTIRANLTSAAEVCFKQLEQLRKSLAVAEASVRQGGARGQGTTSFEIRRVVNQEIALGNAKKGSVTYAQLYTNTERRQQPFTELLPTPHAADEDIPPCPRDLWGCDERETIIPEIVRCLEGALGDGSPYQVHNTHATPAFQRTWLKPAIIITLRGHKPCELHAVVVIEVQRGDLDDAHRGKCIEYCNHMLAVNPMRDKARCYVTNSREVEVVEVCVDKESGAHTTYYYPAVRLSEQVTGGSEGKQAGKKRKRSPVPPAPVPALGWKHMVAALRAEPAQLGMPDMGVKLGGEKVYPDKFLGGGRDACVFRVRDLACKRFYIARADVYKREKEVLEAIKKSRTKHPRLPGRHYLPWLVAHSDGDRCLWTMPVTVDMEHLTSKTLGQLFDALEYLHAIGYIHGDLEPKHIQLSKDGTTAHIIDFSSAIKIGLEYPQGYGGTLLFACDEVFEAVRTGTVVRASWKQDLVALVKTVYCLIHPSGAQRLFCIDVRGSEGPLVSNIKSFWDNEFKEDNKAGKKWRQLVDAAHGRSTKYKEYEEIVAMLRDELQYLVPAC